MERDTKSGSVGPVQTQVAHIALPAAGFVLDCGQALPELTIAYETYGELNPDRDNVIFICHALTGDAHVAGWYEGRSDSLGWWDEMVGPGKGIDTNYYHVICANILGGCKGTTGPSTVHPATGRPYGSSFPPLTVADIVNAHVLLLEHLGIHELAAVIGGSFGGMQALDWAIRYPDRVHRCICIAAGKSLASQALAFDIVGREAIASDPCWHGGDYYGADAVPRFGLSLARKLGHITYLSPEMMEEKFGRVKTPAPDDPNLESPSMFQVESYLAYQGAKFVARFDANSYMCITRAMDHFDLVEKYGSLSSAFEPIRAKTLVVGLSSDWLFPPQQSAELANALLQVGKSVSYCCLHAPHGHDAFLVDIRHLSEALHAFLPWVTRAGRPRRPDRDGDDRESFRVIERWVREGAHVLDIGCGNGTLLSRLANTRAIRGLGIDIDLQHVIEVIDKGHDIFQNDVDNGFCQIPDAAFDCAILSETLPEVNRPGMAVREMLRVAREGVVAFSNAGHWRRRLRMLFKGRIPLKDGAALQADDEPWLHPLTLRDFEALCRRQGAAIQETVCIPSGRASRLLVALGFRNLGADRVLARIARQGAVLSKVQQEYENGQ